MISTRIGFGYDLHRLVDNRPLILAGITIPYEKGLLGHSDADVVTHALIDSLLGACALGDIGRMFPDTDPANKDADSLALLKKAYQKVIDVGWTLGNADLTIIAEKPKLFPFVEEMRASIAITLETSVDQISIKAKTNEGVDATGLEQAISCHCIALLCRT